MAANTNEILFLPMPEGIGFFADFFSNSCHSYGEIKISPMQEKLRFSKHPAAKAAGFLANSKIRLLSLTDIILFMHQMDTRALMGSGVYIKDLGIYADPIMNFVQKIGNSPEYQEAVDEVNRRVAQKKAEGFVDLFSESLIPRLWHRIERRKTNSGYVTREFSEEEIPRILAKAGLYPDMNLASTDLSNALQTDFSYVDQFKGKKIIRYAWVGNPENHKFRLHKSVEKL